MDCLWKKKFKKEHEEFETMENVNRLLLENVLPAHVAAHFIGDKLNEVWCKGLGLEGGEPPEGTVWSCAARCFGTSVSMGLGLADVPRRQCVDQL